MIMTMRISVHYDGELFAIENLPQLLLLLYHASAGAAARLRGHKKVVSRMAEYKN